MKTRNNKSNAEKPITLKPLEFEEAVADLLKVKPTKPRDNVGMPECRMCGHRRPAGHYLVITEETGKKKEVSEYVCNPCWRLINKGGRKGHFFRATGQRWWLPQYRGN